MEWIKTKLSLLFLNLGMKLFYLDPFPSLWEAGDHESFSQYKMIQKDLQSKLAKIKTKEGKFYE